LKVYPQINHLSAGLQPKVFFSSFQGNEKEDLITFTNPKLMMGGAYIWETVGTWKQPVTGSTIPLYGNKVLLDNEKHTSFFPIQSHPELSFQTTQGMLSVIERSENREFKINDEYSEKYGIGLFQKKIGHLNIAKIESRDINGNGLDDVVIGTNDWSEYHPRTIIDGKEIETRWNHKEYRPFDEKDQWRGGKLQGQVYYFENKGLDPEDEDAYLFADPIIFDNINQYGFATPVFHDFTGDGLEDIIIGSFLHDIMFFKRLKPKIIDGREIPQFSKGTPLLNADKNPMKLYGVINYLAGNDITKNGKMDLVIGSESGYISLLENLGELSDDGIPLFEKQIYLLQDNAPLKADVLSVPSVAELRPDKIDLVIGTAGGDIDYFQDLIAPFPKMMWHLPKLPRVLPLSMEKGSIQGPSEIGWGYIAPTLFDWNGNGLYDLIFSDINGEHHLSLNSGSKTQPDFVKPIKLKEKSTGKPLTTVWRVKPSLLRTQGQDNQDIIKYYCLDEKGILTEYIKIDRSTLEKVRNITTQDGRKINFCEKFGGSLGRMKFQLFDWYENGRVDLLVGTTTSHNFQTYYPKGEMNSFPHATVAVLKNYGTNSNLILDSPKFIKLKESGLPMDLGHHSVAPEAYIYNNETFLLIGTENGCIYKFKKEELFI
jgi:hypothetical protein